MSIAGPALIQEFRISATEMGSVYSAFILGYALLMIPGGWLTDRLGPRRTLLIMGASSAALTGMTILGGRPGLGDIHRHCSRVVSHSPGFGICDCAALPCLRAHDGKLDTAHAARAGPGLCHCGLVARRCCLAGHLRWLILPWLAWLICRGCDHNRCTDGRLVHASG